MIKRFMDKARTGDVDFREVVRHSILAFITLGLAGAVQLLFDLILARKFGAGGVGVFYLAFSIVFMLSLLGRLGFNRAVVRYIPGFVQKEDWDGIQGLKRTAYRMTILLSTILGAITFAFAPFIAGTLFNHPEISKYVRWFALSLPPLSLMYVQSGFLSGLKAVKESVFLERVSQNAIAIIFILLLAPALGVGAAVIGYSFATLLSVGLGAILLRRFLPAVKSHVPFSRKVLFFIAVPLLFVDFSNQMTGQLNVLILGAQASPAAVGIFNTALKVSTLIGLVLTGVNAIATTKIAELHTKGDKEKLEMVASKTAGFALLCGLPLIIFFFVRPGFVLGLFGADFRGGVFVLRTLVMAQVINLGFGSVVQILAMTGYHKQLAYATVATVLILNAGLSLVLVPIYGINGAGIAVAISLVAKNTVLLIMIKKYLNIWSLPFKSIGQWIRGPKAV